MYGREVLEPFGKGGWNRAKTSLQEDLKSLGLTLFMAFRQTFLQPSIGNGQLHLSDPLLKQVLQHGV